MTAVIRAIEYDGVQFAFAGIPQPNRGTQTDVLVRIERTSLNRGEFSFPWERAVPAGWDAYGIVVETSEDGAGPAIGSRVATWSFFGAWSEFRVVDRANLAIVPSDVSDEVAAALPVVGLTAVRSLRQLGLKRGDSLAVTGATGGVGHLLVQIAHRFGLRVTAVVRDEGGRRWLRDKGIVVDQILVGDDLGQEGMTFDAVIDTVGGDLLSRILAFVRPEGRTLIVGAASNTVAKINTAEIVSKRLDLLTYKDYSPAGSDLKDLFKQIDRKEITLVATDGGDWHKIVDAGARALLGRGKLTLRVSHD